MDCGPLPASSGLGRPPAAGWNTYALIHSMSTRARRNVQYAQSHNHTRIQSLAHPLSGSDYMQMDQGKYSHATGTCTQTGQLELSIRPNVSNTSSGCPFSSLRVLPAAFVSPSPCNRLFHYSPLLHQLSPSSTVLPRDICCPKTICLSPLSGHTLCPLPSTKDIFRHWFMCLTECVRVFSTLVFTCHPLLPVFHYSHCLLLAARCSLLNTNVVRNCMSKHNPGSWKQQITMASFNTFKLNETIVQAV